MMMVGWWKGRKQPLSDHPSPGTPLHLNLHHEDDEEDDDDDHDGGDIYIMVECLCMLRKSDPKDFVISPVSRHFPYSKVSRNRKTTKYLEKGFCCFSCF